VFAHRIGKDKVSIGGYRMTALLRWTIRIHKWVALLVGLQVVLWVLGGFMMSLLDIDKVHGDHNVAPQVREPVDLAHIMPVAEAAAGAGLSDVLEVQVETWNTIAIYRFETADNPSVMVDAVTGDVLSPIDEATAIHMALTDHISEPEIIETVYFENPPQEYGRPGPVWQINFDDGHGTRTYVSPMTGEVVTHRNDVWRVFDFFWKLHIMAYANSDDGEDFNHPILISFAALALLSVLAGLLLLILRMQHLVRVELANLGAKRGGETGA
jgi:uncharacterized iron-regulated membrane protein